MRNSTLLLGEFLWGSPTARHPNYNLKENL